MKKRIPTYPVQQPYYIRPSKFSRGDICIICPCEGGRLTRAARLAICFARGRYTHRDGGFIMTLSKAEKFVRFYESGWDGNVDKRELIAPALAAYKTKKEEPA